MLRITVRVTKLSFQPRGKLPYGKLKVGMFDMGPVAAPVKGLERIAAPFGSYFF